LKPALREEAPDDAPLLARVAVGDLGALGALFDRYHRLVRAVARQAGVRDAQLDDVVQDTFLRLVQLAPRYDGRAVARPWIAGTAWRVSAEHRRSARRWFHALRSLGHADAPAGPVTPEEQHARRQCWEAFQARLAALSEPLRAAYVLVELQGLSGEEVARALEIPVATVWTRLHNARRKLLAEGPP
jgi:RNA polymerase sigma-70 factor (ECF subfamily)